MIAGFLPSSHTKLPWSSSDFESPNRAISAKQFTLTIGTSTDDGHEQRPGLRPPVAYGNSRNISRFGRSLWWHHHHFCSLRRGFVYTHYITSIRILPWNIQKYIRNSQVNNSWPDLMILYCLRKMLDKCLDVREVGWFWMEDQLGNVQKTWKDSLKLLNLENLKETQTHIHTYMYIYIHVNNK